MKKYIQIFSLVLAGLMLVMVLGCSEDPTGLNDGPNVVLDITYDTPSAKLLQLVGGARLTISGVAMDPMVVSSEVDPTSGRFEIVVDSVPSGPARVFTLELLEITPQKQERVIYAGVTVANVTPDVVVNVPIVMVPAVPMVKLTPKYQRLDAGGVINLELKVYNLPLLRSAYVVFNYGYSSHYGFVEPQTGTRGGDVPPDRLFAADMINDNTQYRVQAGSPNDFLPIVGLAGTGTLARIPMLTKAFADTSILPIRMNFDLESVNLNWADTLSEFGRVFYETAEVQIDSLPDRIITFPDPVLHDEVWYAIYGYSSAPGDIWLSDALNYVTRLNLMENEVRDLTGIGQLANLNSLEMGYVSELEISYNLTPVADLHRLQLLAAPDAGITDIRPIADLTRLSVLDLSGNEISSISALAGLSQLLNVDLSGNQISDISALENLLYLSEVSLESNNIGDIGPLVRNVGFKGNETIYLYGNPLDNREQQANIAALRAKGVTVYYELVN